MDRVSCALAFLLFLFGCGAAADRPQGDAEQGKPDGLDPRPPDASDTLTITIEGGGAGEILVETDHGGETPCDTGCTVPVVAGENVIVVASTAGGYGGMTGDCEADWGVGECEMIAQPGAGAIAVSMWPKATWTRFLEPGVAVSQVECSSSDEIWIDVGGLTRLSTTGETLAVEPERKVGLPGPDGTMVSLAGDQVVAHDASGAVLWTYPFPGAAQLAVSFGGEVAVRSADTLARLSPDGTPAWTRSISAPFSNFGIAIDDSGLVYLAREGASAEAYDARRFAAADGAELPVWFAVAQQYMPGGMAVDREGALVTASSGHSHAYLIRLDANGVRDWTQQYSAHFESYVSGGLTMGHDGGIGWWHDADDEEQADQGFAIYGADGVGTGGSWFGKIRTEWWAPSAMGVHIVDAAICPDGHFVVVGRYEGLRHSAGVVQYF